MFDLEKIGSGEWFPFQESIVDQQTGKIEWLPIKADSQDKVCFKSPDADETRIRQEKYRGKKVNTPVLNTLSKAMEICVSYEQTPDQMKNESMEFWDSVIVDWELSDPEGTPIPCTTENKYILVKGHMPFLRFCNRSLQMLQGIKMEDDQKKEKN
jgi:hypothetical protein